MKKQEQQQSKPKQHLNKVDLANIANKDKAFSKGKVITK